MDGWIKIHRQIKDNWIWKSDNRFKWWIDILLTVNHSESKVLIKGTLIECKRGQCIRSLNTWAKDWNVSKGTVRDFFKLLQSDKMLYTESLQFTTRITICNYDSYQVGGTRKVNAKETLSLPKQEGEEEKEVKESIKENFLNKIYFEKSPDIDSAFKDYLKLRVESKFTMTDRAVDSLVKKLRIFSDGNKNEALNIIENAILGKWKSFYKKDN